MISIPRYPTRLLLSSRIWVNFTRFEIMFINGYASQLAAVLVEAVEDIGVDRDENGELGKDHALQFGLGDG